MEVPALADTYLTTRGGVNAEYGNARQMLAFYDSRGDNKGSIYIKFEFNGVIPRGSTINSAKVQLHQSQGSGLAIVTLTAHVITNNWNSDVTLNTKPTIGEAVAAVSTDNMQVNRNWLITDTFKEWLSGARPNYGLYITNDRAENQSYQRSFDTLENRINQPVLVVDYTPPAAQNQGGAGNPVNVQNPVGSINIKPIATIGPIVLNIPQGDLTISEIKSENITETSAKISWKTNRNSTSWVIFGIATQGDLFNVLSGQSDSVKDHGVNLSNLYPNRKYSYKVFSKDANGKQTFGPISYFTTAQSGQIVAEENPAPSSSPVSSDSNPISDLQEKIENKVAEAAINKSLNNSSSSANEAPGSGSATPQQTDLKGAGFVNLVSGMVGLNKLAGILLIVLGLMSLVGVLIVYILSKKVHHHVRMRVGKNYAKKFKNKKK